MICKERLVLLKLAWKKDLHVNHKDHTKVNTLENLETLCLRCHASKSHYKKQPKGLA